MTQPEAQDPKSFLFRFVSTHRLVAPFDDARLVLVIGEDGTPEPDIIGADVSEDKYGDDDVFIYSARRRVEDVANMPICTLGWLGGGHFLTVNTHGLTGP